MGLARPDPDLVAVRVDGDPELVLRREDGDPHRFAGCVPHVMCPRRPGREADDVARLEHPLAVGAAERRAARDDDQPLLVGPFEVVRADRLAGRQVVDGHAEPGRPESRPEAGCAAQIPGRLRPVRPGIGLAAEEVEDLHVPRLTPVEAHQAVRQPVLLDVRDMAEAGLSRTHARPGGSAPRPWRRTRSSPAGRKRSRGRTGRAPVTRDLGRRDPSSPMKRSTPASPGSAPTIASHSGLSATRYVWIIPTGRPSHDDGSARCSALEPRNHERQVLLGERAESSISAPRKRAHTDVSVSSSRTRIARHANR